ncbi:MAG: PLP-dependent aminotransferase family protein, partial [Chloroflexota bacterium]
MSRTSYAIPFAPTTFDSESVVPLYKQLYEEVRSAILNGRLSAGTRLPSTRTLADELDVSRNTVSSAFDQLLAEGYLESHVGDGTYVARTLPDDLLHIDSSQPPPRQTAPKGRRLSQRGNLLMHTPVGVLHTQIHPYAFCSGLPALDAFPFDIWARLEARFWQKPQRELLTYGNAAGYKPLREAVAGYLGTARAVRCTPDQVIIVAGSQQALDLTGRVLLDPGDSVWIEDPGYLGAR